MTAKDFILSLPSRVKPEALGESGTLFHFDMEGEGGGQYTVEIANGSVNVDEGLQGEAKCKVSGKAQTLVGIVNREVNPTMAVMMGKIKVSNLSEMMKFGKVFGLM